jgi:hypothetical protein
MRTILDTSDAVRSMMDAIGIKGSFDVRQEGNRSVGWVGKPSGEDYEVVVTIKPLPPLGDS